MSPAAQSVLAELESLGKEQTRTTYRRHGVGGDVHGVSYADLGKLRKRLKTDHALARELWASGNHDARVLATMVADPARMDDAELDRWAADLRNYPVTDAFAGLASRAPGARRKAEEWGRSDDEWVGRAGWLVLAHLAGADPALADDDLAALLPVIEREIHTRKNRTRDAMNSALIAIGIRSPSLERQALAAAARIGTVEVDHGDTNCKTPDAAAYIRKTAAHRAKKVGR